MGIEIHIPELSGEKLMYNAQGVPVPLLTIPGIGNLYLTNTLLTTWVVMLLLVIFAIVTTRGMRMMPSGIQNVSETIVEQLLNFVEGVMPRRQARTFMPFIATLFIFILTANYFGLLPFIGTAGVTVQVQKPATETTATAPATTVPAGTHAEFVPILRAPNSDWNTTLAMALISFVTIQVVGFAVLGFIGYAKHLSEPGGVMGLLMGPLHIVGEFARIISLSARLFGNILAGEILLGIMGSFSSLLFAPFGIIGLGLFLPVVFLFAELLFGFIQALIFSLLTLIFISMVALPHGSAGHEEETGHEQPHSA